MKRNRVTGQEYYVRPEKIKRAKEQKKRLQKSNEERKIFLKDCTVEELELDIEKSKRHFASYKQEKLDEYQQGVREKTKQLAIIHSLDVEISALQGKLGQVRAQSQRAQANQNLVGRFMGFVSDEMKALYNQELELSRIIEIKSQERKSIRFNEPIDMTQVISENESKEINMLQRLLEQKLKSREKEQRQSNELAKLKAVAASAIGKTREHAITVRDQVVKSESCPYCGISLEGVLSHLEHIYPVSKGGHSTINNMVHVCSKCNIKKRDLTLNQFIDLYSLDRVVILERLRVQGKDY